MSQRRLSKKEKVNVVIVTVVSFIVIIWIMFATGTMDRLTAPDPNPIQWEAEQALRKQREHDAKVYHDVQVELEKQRLMQQEREGR